MYQSTQINPSSLNALTKVAKIIYDDVTFVVLNYIISHESQLIEEQEMANNLNISYGTVRTCLTTLEKHGILLSSEHIRKREDEEETQTKTDSQQKNYRSMHKSAVAFRKNKTSDWKLNPTFYNRIKNRFEEMKKHLNYSLEQRSTLWFECPKCLKKYTESEGSFNSLVCIQCDSKPKLTEKGREDVTQLRKKCNEIIEVLNDIFITNDKGGPEFIHVLTEKDFKDNGKQWSHNERKNPLMNNKFDIVFSNLEEPTIAEGLMQIQNNKNKKERFHDIMEYYIRDHSSRK